MAAAVAGEVQSRTMPEEKAVKEACFLRTGRWGLSGKMARKRAQARSVVELYRGKTRKQEGKKSKGKGGGACTCSG